MAIAHDAASRSHSTDALSHTAASAFSWTHTPVGTPKGVVVTITQPLGSGDEVSGVTYGGVAMTRVISVARTATEQMRVYIYHLGSGILTGARTVQVTSTGTSAKQAHAFTMTAAAGMDTTVDASSGADLGIIANPSRTVTHTGSLTGWAGYAAHGYGGAAPVTTGLQAGETYRFGHDPGAAVAMVYSRHGGAAAASSTYGYTTLTSDDQLLAALVVKEVAPPVALSGTSTTQTTGTGTPTTIPPATWGDNDVVWETRARSWIGWPTEHRSVTATDGSGSLSLTPPSLSTAVGFNSADTVEDFFDAPTVTEGAGLYEWPLAGISTIETAGAGTLGELAGPENAPDAILAAVNLDGPVVFVQDDPAAPGPEWLTAPVEDAPTWLRVSFPTPSTAPGSGGPTVFQVLVRRPDIVGAADPVVDLELWEAGVFRTLLTSGASVASESGQIVTGTMDPGLLTDPSGADAELVVRSRDGGG